MSLSISRRILALLRVAPAVLAAAAFVAAQGVGRPSFASAPTADSVNASVAALPSTHFRIGEKLRYNISWGRFVNAAVADMTVVSRGMLSGHDAIELQSKLKTMEVVNAAIVQLDQTRHVFVSPDSGMPLYSSRRDNTGIAPKESAVDFSKRGAPAFDLLSLMYKIRYSAGSGTFSLFEDEKLYTVTVQAGKNERVYTEAGQFDTIICNVESDYLVGKGIKDLKINLTTDADHVPVLFRMRTMKGDFRAAIAAIELSAATIVAPVAMTTPQALPTPAVKPKPTATPYIENQPLAPELGFDLGEKLDYSLTVKGVAVGILSLSAKERKLFQNQDSLHLVATVTKADPSYKTFVTNDVMDVYVDPLTLVPRYLSARFSGGLSWLNQTLTFDPTGAYSLNGGALTEAPMGTHTVLSLFYAMRSFNLKPSRDPSNPVNDTRVSVFWEKKPYIFTLRPNVPEMMAFNGDKISTQLINASSGDAAIDSAKPRVWLATDTRVPVRFIIGPIQADLITSPKPIGPLPIS